MKVDQYLVFGEALENSSPARLRIEAAQATYAAARDHRDFSVVDLRKPPNAADDSEILIVDVECDRIPPKNAVGIQYRERLALRFFQDSNLMPEVRALRVGFPDTLHQNHVLEGEPPNLCLYFEPWSTAARTWTAQKHLGRILWWLEQTALGKLHRSDQPLEQLYFKSDIELVLPHDFYEKLDDSDYRIVISRLTDRGKHGVTLIGHMRRKGEKVDGLPYSCVAITLRPVVHFIERFPSFLGELEDTFAKRGASFISLLFADIKSRFEGRAQVELDDERTILLLSIPIVREAGGIVERRSFKAYIVMASISDIGLKAGVLDKHERQVIVRRTLGIIEAPQTAWKDISLLPLEVHNAFNPTLARQVSGLEDRGPKAVLCGVGALGSALFNLWARSGWGEWTLIDPDHIKPHNLARHTAIEPLLGLHKVDAVRKLDDALWGAGCSRTNSVPESATAFTLEPVLTALKSAELIIDVTTTLDYPREHAANAELPRGLSVFLTPNGKGAVLLAEDERRRFRLDAIEAQYYRLVLSQSWGDQHLVGSQATFWSGAGCRDLSTVIPGEYISVHAGNLAHQVRQIAGSSEADIRVWHYNSDVGALSKDSVPVEETAEHDLDGLKVVWDAGVRRKVRQWRASALPAETGGVLLGYFDLTKKKVYVVDVLPPPPDSQGDRTGFTRGIEGLEVAVADAQKRTANIVGYIGEWHTHPRRVSSRASSDDVFLLVHLGLALYRDGLPALMLIVGETNESWYCAEARA